MTLCVRNLSFQYDAGEKILDQLSFDLGPGQLMILAGQNGAGKSTLINLLAGIFKPNLGEISIKGSADLKTLRRLSTLVPQNIEHWLLGETGREDIFLGLDTDNADIQKRFEILSTRWNLDSILDQEIETLSLGQKKRLAIIAALLKDSPAVFLDESLAGLDWPGQQKMVEDLARLKSDGRVVVVVTHDPELLAALADFWLLLKPRGEHFHGPTVEAVARFENFGIRPIHI